MNILRVLDVFHVGLMCLLLFGAFMPVDMLPSLIFFQVFFLSRYHDYCVISRVTQLANTVYSGCEEEKDFTGEMADMYNTFGVNPSKRLLSNLSTAIVSISILVSIYRMSRKYKFSLISRNRCYFNSFILFNLVFIVFSEMAIDYYADARFPACEAQEEQFTPVEKIKLEDENRFFS